MIDLTEEKFDCCQYDDVKTKSRVSKGETALTMDLHGRIIKFRFVHIVASKISLLPTTKGILLGTEGVGGLRWPPKIAAVRQNFVSHRFVGRRSHGS